RPATRAYGYLAHRPAGDVPVVASAAGQACVTGSWGYTDHTGAARTSANAQVQAWDDDTSGPDDLLATGLTDANGGFLLCFNNSDEDGTGQDVYLRFATENTNWIVRNPHTRKSFQ